MGDEEFDDFDRGDQRKVSRGQAGRGEGGLFIDACSTCGPGLVSGSRDHQ
jgi:hypothetical protein